MLTRIYGTAFFSKAELDEYLERLELARARDHRLLGRQLGLFHFSELAPGSAFWTPNGATLWNTLRDVAGAMARVRGYTEVKTPQLFDAQVWETSGHRQNYGDNMFITSDDEHPMGLKPMNCPGHCVLFGMERHSYRELPVRLYEPGILHRKEPSGTLHGLLRVRSFAQDDAHIFCTEAQIRDEVAACLRFGFDIYEMFGFATKIELSTRPDKRIGDDALWDHAEGALTSALEDLGVAYQLNPGDGAFYGPKIDIHMTDSLGRSWQLGTVQLDYNMPTRFELAYTGADNAEHRPVMIHRALFGSFERFIGILLEHLGGELPAWLAPVQAIVLPISDHQNEAGAAVLEALSGAALRGELDARSESVGRKIRDAELRRIPYMLIVGEREAADGTVAVRERGAGDTGAVAADEFVARLAAETATGSG
jgi:threonyl-tRNA synthetase